MAAPVPLGTYHKVVPAQQPSPHLWAELEAIPGVRRKGRVLFCPANAGWILDWTMRRAGVAYHHEFVRGGYYCPRFTPPASAEEAERWLREAPLRPGTWFDDAAPPAGRRFKPFQKAGVLRVLQAGSGALWWKAGAGKTAGAIALACAAPTRAGDTGAIVTVTKAAVRRQWAREIRNWTTIEPWVSDPSFRRRGGWRPPKDYIAQAFLAGHRPWFVVSWEELPDLIFGEAAHIIEGSRDDVRRAAAAQSPEDTDEWISDRDALCRVHGVGPKVGSGILRHFGTLAQLQDYGRRHPVDRFRAELLKVPGLGPATAANLIAVYTTLRPEPPAEATAGFLREVQIQTVVFDEIHLGSNRVRFKSVATGEIDDAGKAVMVHHNRRNRSAAAQELSKRAVRRFGTTATPIPNRVRDLWGQWDLIDPHGAGPYWTWATRYAGAHPGGYNGAMIDTGASNLAELTCRLGLTDANGARYMNTDGTWAGTPPAWTWVSQVPKQVSHGQLPSMVREVRRLDPMLLSNGDAGASKAIRQAKDKEDHLTKLAEWACTRKRPQTTDDIVEAVCNGEKVLVLSATHDDVERTWAMAERKLRKEWVRRLRAADEPKLAELLEQKLPPTEGGRDRGYAHRVPGCWYTHGGLPDQQRDHVVLGYMGWLPEAGCIVPSSDPRHAFGVELDATGRSEIIEAELARVGAALALPNMGAVLMGTVHYIGTGLDLHDTDLLLWPMLPITPKQQEQGEGRCMRIGQRRSLRIVYYIAEGTVDEHIAEVLIDKLPPVAEITGQTELHEVAEQIGGTEDEEAVLAAILARVAGGLLGDADMEDDGD